MRLIEVKTSDGRTRYIVLDEAGQIVEPIARYLKHLDQRGYARNTLKTYGHALKLYFVFLSQKRLDFRTITLDDMAAFVQWLKLPYDAANVLPSYPVEQARTNSTINDIIKAVSSFYDYLWRRDDIPTDMNARTR